MSAGHDALRLIKFPLHNHIKRKRKQRNKINIVSRPKKNYIIKTLLLEKRHPTIHRF